MAAVVAHHTFGAPGGAGCVKDVQRVGGRDRHRFHGRGGGFKVVPVEVPVGLQLKEGLGALQHHTLAWRVRCASQGLVHHGLIGDHAFGFDSARCREQHLGRDAVDADGQFRGRESPKHHDVHGAKASAGEHRHQRFGHHRHVDDHPVAALDPECP